MAVEPLEWKGTAGPVVVMRLAAQGTIAAATPNATEVLGLDWDAATCTLADLVHPGDRAAVTNAVAQAVTGTSAGLDCRAAITGPNEDGARWLRIELPLADGDGERYAFVADITARRRRADLAERLLEAAPDAVIVTDEAGHIVLVNAQAERLFGYDRRELLDLRVEDLIPERFRPGHPDNRTSYREHPRFRPMGAGLSLFARRKDGSEIPVEISLAPLDTPQGVLVSASVRDVTAAKTLEAELEHARDAAVEASRLKSEFVATMSHEIRTPVNGVIGMTALLLDTDLTPEQKDFAETIRSSGEALLNVINDVLDFSKIEAGRIELEDIDVDVRTIVAEVAELLSDRAHTQQLELVTHVDASVPPLLRGDPGRIRQVLINLVTNAIKFTPSGEVVVHVDAEPCDDGTVMTRFEVRDTGIGMEPAVLSRLFDSFSQADASTTRRYGGSGLGLAISKRLAELQGGDIGVASEPGKGSRFWFTARLAVAPDGVDLDASHPLLGRRILVVDDNATVRSTMVELLTAWRMDAEAADSAQTGLAALREANAAARPFDVALVDQVLEGPSGIELAWAARADPSMTGTQIVLLVPGSRRTEAREAHGAGLAALVAKPVRQSTLHDTLVTLCAGPTVAAVSTPQSTPVLERGLVLVVEDNIVNQKVATRMLERLGYQVELAGNGLEALEALDREAYDAVLMDCQMPEMDGFEATRELRRREQGERHVPVIALTASAIAGDRERCLAAGMDDYLTKPLSPPALAAVLNHWLGIGRHHGRDTGTAAPRAGAAAVAPAPAGAPVAAPASPTSLAETFRRDSRLRYEALVAALERGDRMAAAHNAHTLRGSSGMMGIDDVWDTCGRLDTLLNRDPAPDDDGLVSALVDLLGRQLDAAATRVNDEGLLARHHRR